MKIARYLLLALACASAPAFADVFVSVRLAPPVMPVYEQPVVPGPDYIWTPGYWAWDPEDGGYYWVPGAWVLAPQPGYLWTPGYWAFEYDVYRWHPGYWGPHIGYYGGINYGFGYFGHGYEGGYWDGPHFRYNTAVTQVNVVNVHNTYHQTVINSVTNVTRVSYNGGSGVHAQPTHDEQQAQHERHVGWTPQQNEHEQQARQMPEQHVSVNHGRPAVLATQRGTDRFADRSNRGDNGWSRGDHGNQGDTGWNRGNRGDTGTAGVQTPRNDNGARPWQGSTDRGDAAPDHGMPINRVQRTPQPVRHDNPQSWQQPERAPRVEAAEPAPQQQERRPQQGWQPQRDDGGWNERGQRQAPVQREMPEQRPVQQAPRGQYEQRGEGQRIERGPGPGQQNRGERPEREHPERDRQRNAY
ncbi:MAG TPA: hypothetical protein VHE37_01630 [Nevskiaceae bacterium]|nr:hypothetical protein [Nevskiaceae bacterium]